MNTGDTTPERKLKACCISHEFLKAALKSPSKIAVIHAYGGATIARQFHAIYDAGETGPSGNSNCFDELVSSRMTSSNPPVYEGDECFTFSEILSAVDSLSSHLRRILDGADDSQLIKPPPGSTPVEQSVHAPEFSESTGLIVRQCRSNMHIPNILAVYMEPSVEYLVAVLSVLRCGAAFLPLDPSWPRERIMAVLSSSKASFIIGCESSIDGRFHKLDNLYWLVKSRICPVLSISMKDVIQAKCEPSDLVWPCEGKSLRLFCYVIYTSGSTGHPKGVCGTELGLLNRYLWMQELYPLQGEEHLLFKTSISFVDHLQEFLGALLATCTLVIPPFNQLKENIFYVVDFLQEYSINRFIAVPSLVTAILPVFRSLYYMRIQSTIKLLVLSGEALHISLWKMLVDTLPQTALLNLYGSTEVSGDCTYFDCKSLPLLLKHEVLSSVPIGFPINNCNVMLVGEDAPHQGEIYVRGICVAAGYFCFPSITPLDCAELSQNACFNWETSEHGAQYYFKTGDFARKLPSGELVFLGRKDRTVKINGQRIALEEIESVLKEHPNIVDAAVICHKNIEEVSHIEALLIPKRKDINEKIFVSSIRRWTGNKLPAAMVPSCFSFTESFPLSSSGKVDYWLLADSSCCEAVFQNGIDDPNSDVMQVIEKAFCDALMIKKISIHDDFFLMGGNSITAAHVSYKLGINMKDLYRFPTPFMLQTAFMRKEVTSNYYQRKNAHLDMDTREPERSKLHSIDSRIPSLNISEPHKRLSRALGDVGPNKYLKTDLSLQKNSMECSIFSYSHFMSVSCSFNRCNKVTHGRGCEDNNLCQKIWSSRILKDKRGSMQQVWKVHLVSCVDASPLIVVKESHVYMFIGSHSQKFVCVDVKSGCTMWERGLQGRIESTAAILDDFSQVVVGCYQGSIYFLSFSTGSIYWSFQTPGEVKSQPVVDKCRHLVWCGSHDHHLYALDYKNYCCIYKLPCGGSIFGSPAIYEDKLYVASTSGRVTALDMTTLPFSILWLQELGAPIFGSLSVNSTNGNVICCTVDGSVVALDAKGLIVWKGKTGGPIFAGPCISGALPNQVLICSRDGSIYSFHLEKGDILWKHDVGCPITSSAYIDENLLWSPDNSYSSKRFVCVCSSSGSIKILGISLDATVEHGEDVVQEFARLDLEGDIFSSPVMIGGMIFVGCRDDFVHCIKLEGETSV